MKQKFRVLTLVFMLLMCFSILPSKAQAYTINCFTVATGSAWPNRDVLSCGSTGNLPDSQTTSVLTAIQSINTNMPDAYAKLTAAVPTVFVFHNVADMTTYFTERSQPVPPVSGTPAAFTAYSSSNVPLYTVVFADYGTYQANAAVHELGHWADYLYLGLVTPAQPTAVRTSDSLIFRTLAVKDRANFDRLSYPLPATQAQCGTGGIFTGQQDGATPPVYICSGANGTGSTLNSSKYPLGTLSSDVLDIGWPIEFDISNSATFREIFAEGFAVVNGTLDGGITGFDRYFTGFQCVKAYVRKVGHDGALPSQADLESAGCTVPCVAYPSTPGTNYPQNGHMFNCMGLPRNSAELTMQSNIMSSVNSSISTFVTDKAKLNTKNVDFYVFYNPVDAYLAKRLGVTDSSPTATEVGKSFVEPPVGNSTLPNASSLVFVFTKTEWAALYATVPTSYNGARFSGSVSHELGHQIDRIWAHDLGYAPTANALISLNSTNQAYYLSALAWDWAAMSSADKATLWSTYPYLMINSTTIDNYQMFGEQKANVPGVGLGGTTGKSFLGAKLTCASWLVTTMENNNGAFPAAPLSAQCHGHTTW